MPKERTINPAAQQRKEEKRKAVAKSKKQVQAQRNEKLAKRNPQRIQQQIDELKGLERGGVLRPKDKEALSQLEKELKGINRAREALGDAAPKFGERKDQGNARDQQRARRAQLPQNLGKRRREAEDAHNSGSETDPEVRAIPMPRDTPPPFPKKEYIGPQTGANGIPVSLSLPAKPVLPPAQTVYSSAPQIRDLKKEAMRFMPAAVQAHKAKLKGQGKLLEPEEMDRLEKAGYMAAKQAANADEEEQRRAIMAAEVQDGAINTSALDEEAARFEREMASLQQNLQAEQRNSLNVQMDNAEDDGT